MNLLLAETAEKVHQLCSPEETVSNLGWQAPVVLNLGSNISFFNAENGSVIRNINLGASISPMKSMLYAPHERCFIFAFGEDRITIANNEEATEGSVHFQAMPGNVTQLCQSGDAILVGFENGRLLLTSLQSGRLVLPSCSLPTVVTSGSIVKSCLFGTKDVFGVVEMINTSNTTANGTRTSSRQKAQLSTTEMAQKCTLRIWQHTSHTSTSPIWVHPTQTPKICVNIPVEENSVLLTTLIESQRSVHLLLQNSTFSTWIKLDFTGRELFRVKLDFVVSYAQVVKDEIFVTSKSSTTGGGVTVCRYSARYGTRIHTTLVQMPARSSNGSNNDVMKMCFQSALTSEVGSSSNGNVGMIFAIPSPTSTNASSEGMTIYRRELTLPASNSENSTSSLGLILGCNKRQKVDSSTTTAVAAAAGGGGGGGGGKAYDNELQSLHNQYRQLLQEESENVELIVDYFQMDKRKRRRPMDLLTVSSEAMQAFLSNLSSSSTWSEAQSQQLAAIIRRGSFSLTQYPQIFATALAEFKVDILAEMVRFSADITEVQVVQILQSVLLIPQSKLTGYAIKVANIIAVPVRNGEAANGHAVVNVDDDDNKKTPSKRKSARKAATTPSTTAMDADEAVVPPITPAKVANGHHHANGSKHASLTVIQLTRVIAEMVLYRRARFSPVTMSEALTQVSADTACLLLRMLCFALHDICTLVYLPRAAAASQSHVLPYFGVDQVHAAVEWIEAILDAHFTTFALSARSLQSMLSALHAAVLLCTQAEDAIDLLEIVRGQWSEIERTTKNPQQLQQQKQVQNNALYTVEVLRL